MPSPPHAMLGSAHVTGPFQYRQLKTPMQVTPFPGNDAVSSKRATVRSPPPLGAEISFVLNDVDRSESACPACLSSDLVAVPSTCELQAVSSSHLFFSQARPTRKGVAPNGLSRLNELRRMVSARPLPPGSLRVPYGYRMTTSLSLASELERIANALEGDAGSTSQNR